MSWEQLQSVEEDRRVAYDEERSDPPIACPNDGTVLLQDPRAGGLRCPFDGWHWPTDPDPLRD